MCAPAVAYRQTSGSRRNWSRKATSCFAERETLLATSVREGGFGSGEFALRTNVSGSLSTWQSGRAGRDSRLDVFRTQGSTVFTVGSGGAGNGKFRAPGRERAVGLEDRIKELCIQLLTAHEDAAVQAIASELQRAIHDHIEILRQQLLEIPSATTPIAPWKGD